MLETKMAKLTTQDLDGIRRAHKERLAFRDKTYLLICGGTGCHATGSIRVKDALVAAIEERGLGEKVQVIETGCNGFCAMGPLLVVHPGDIFYQKLGVEDMPELVDSHLINGKPVSGCSTRPGVQSQNRRPDADSLFRPPDAPGPAQQGADRSRVHR
jgi:(2Fe-2S) ferredoxin